jgi:hypothetical protein
MRMIAAGLMRMDGQGRYEDVDKFGTLSGSKWISLHSRTTDILMTLGYDTVELMFTISFHYMMYYLIVE